MWATSLWYDNNNVDCLQIEDQKILFVTDEKGYKDMVKVKVIRLIGLAFPSLHIITAWSFTTICMCQNFCLSQPEVIEFEWNQQKYTKDKPGRDFDPFEL
jgi:hypothetical protein